MTPSVHFPNKYSLRAYLLLLLFITITLYSNTLPKNFTNWDDPEYVVDNPWIHSFSSPNLMHLLTHPFVGHYLPVTMLSYMLDYSLWGLNATGFFFHNLFLHLGSILLVFFLLRKLCSSMPVVFIATALFAWHPTNVESVAWIAERKNLLATFFFLASFYQYIKYAQAKSRPNYLLAILFFTLSLLSKTSAVLAPVLFLFYDRFQGSLKIKELKLYDKIPFLVLSEIMGFWMIFSAQEKNTLHSYHQQGLWLNLINLPELLIEYLKLLLFPHNISAAYIEYGDMAWSSLGAWISLAILTVVAVFCFHKRGRFLFWVSFFFFLILPVLNIVPLPIRISNRYLYLPQIGFWVLLAELLLWMFAQVQSNQRLRNLVLTCFSLWVFWLCHQTYVVSGVWRNSETLWTDTIEKDFFNSTAHFNLGLHYLNHGALNRGGLHMLLSTRMNPSYPSAYNGLGYYYLLKRLPDLAIPQFDQALAIQPDFDQALNNLGKAWADKGDFQKAVSIFYRASSLNPDNLTSRLNILTFLFKTRRWNEARWLALEITKRFPWEPRGYEIYAEASEQMGDFGEAAKGWQEYLVCTNIKDEQKSQIEMKIHDLQSKIHTIP
jgi:Tfp pilus assembly protein PilF